MWLCYERNKAKSVSSVIDSWRVLHFSIIWSQVPLYIPGLNHLIIAGSWWPCLSWPGQRVWEIFVPCKISHHWFSPQYHAWFGKDDPYDLQIKPSKLLDLVQLFGFGHWTQSLWDCHRPRKKQQRSILSVLPFVAFWHCAFRCVGIWWGSGHCSWCPAWTTMRMWMLPSRELRSSPPHRSCSCPFRWRWRMPFFCPWPWSGIRIGMECDEEWAIQRFLWYYHDAFMLCHDDVIC